MESSLEQLERQRLIWRGCDSARPLAARASGWPELDQRLGGLPGAGVTAIHSRPGIGEFRLVWPLMQEHHRLSALIAPPYPLGAEGLVGGGVPVEQLLVVYPESDSSALWSAEQALKSGCCQTVCLWLVQSPRPVQARRLQLAARAGGASLFLFLGTERVSGLPLDLCLQLKPHSKGLVVSVPHRKQGWAVSDFLVSMEARWPELVCAALVPARDSVPGIRAANES